MKYIHAMFAVACLLVVGGAIDAARADDQDEENKGVSLYTPADIGFYHVCRAVNISDKTLGITFALLDNFGHPFSCGGTTECTRGPEERPPLTRPPSFRSVRAQGTLYRSD